MADEISRMIQESFQNNNQWLQNIKLKVIRKKLIKKKCNRIGTNESRSKRI